MPKQISCVTVNAEDGSPVELAVFQHENGGLFAIDASYVEQEAGFTYDPFTGKEFTPDWKENS